MVSKLVIFEKKNKKSFRKTSKRANNHWNPNFAALAPSSYSEFSLNIQTQCDEGARDANNIKVTLVI